MEGWAATIERKISSSALNFRLRKIYMEEVLLMYLIVAQEAELEYRRKISNRAPVVSTNIR